MESQNVPYIYSEVNNIHILDLVQSATLLKEANSYVKSASSEGKTFLFVGTKRQASTLIAQAKNVHIILIIVG
jgi:small subunit ribosomal protein S2